MLHFRGLVRGWSGWSIDHPRILDISIANPNFSVLTTLEFWSAKSLTPLGEIPNKTTVQCCINFGNLEVITYFTN